MSFVPAGNVVPWPIGLPWVSMSVASWRWNRTELPTDGGSSGAACAEGRKPSGIAGEQGDGERDGDEAPREAGTGDGAHAVPSGAGSARRRISARSSSPRSAGRQLAAPAGRAPLVEGELALDGVPASEARHGAHALACAGAATGGRAGRRTT